MDEFLHYEKTFWSRGFQRIAGLDEVGRGSLAGPVVAAVVVMPQGGFVNGAGGSKKISKRKREKLSEKILSEASEVQFGLASPQEIDESNILVATGKAMNRALEKLKVEPDHVVIDGLPMAALDWDHEAVIKGDGLVHSIGCASIVAKVFRDSLMSDLGERNPGYGWDRNAGYGTREHRDALLELGTTSHHRKTFLGHQYKLGI